MCCGLFTAFEGSVSLNLVLRFKAVVTSSLEQVELGKTRADLQFIQQVSSVHA